MSPLVLSLEQPLDSFVSLLENLFFRWLLSSIEYNCWDCVSFCEELSFWRHQLWKGFWMSHNKADRSPSYIQDHLSGVPHTCIWIDFCCCRLCFYSDTSQEWCASNWGEEDYLHHCLLPQKQSAHNFLIDFFVPLSVLLIPCRNIPSSCIPLMEVMHLPPNPFLISFQHSFFDLHAAALFFGILPLFQSAPLLLAKLPWSLGAKVEKDCGR